jgi:hypothetical protein
LLDRIETDHRRGRLEPPVTYGYRKYARVRVRRVLVTVGIVTSGTGPASAEKYPPIPISYCPVPTTFATEWDQALLNDSRPLP